MSTQLQHILARDLSVKDVLRHAVLELQRAHIETASMDARVLLQHVLGLTREELLLNTERKVNSGQLAQYDELVEMRKNRQPVSQLIGTREFWGMCFKVTNHTLDPRPDSETLIEAILARIANREAPLRILDLGTGTGCLLLTLLTEYPNAHGTGVDICGSALNVAQENATRLGLERRSRFLASSWGNSVEGSYDLIISNPPYIPSAAIANLAPEVSRWEPKLALDGGPDGMECYRSIVPQLKTLLNPTGLAVFEIGMGQAKELETIVQASGLQVVGSKDDMAYITRCILVTH